MQWHHTQLITKFSDKNMQTGSVRLKSVVFFCKDSAKQQHWPFISLMPFPDTILFLLFFNCDLQ